MFEMIFSLHEVDPLLLLWIYSIIITLALLFAMGDILAEELDKKLLKAGLDLPTWKTLGILGVMILFVSLLPVLNLIALWSCVKRFLLGEAYERFSRS